MLLCLPVCLDSPSILASHLNFLATFSRVCHAKTTALSAIRLALAHPHISPLHKLQIKLQECRLMLEQGKGMEGEAAIRTAKSIVRHLKSMLNSATAAEPSSSGLAGAFIDASCLVGEWLSKSHAEGVSVIREYLEQAAK